MGKNSKSKKRTKTPPRPHTGALDVVLSVVAILLLTGARTIAGPCSHADGSVAACATAGRVLTGLGFVAVGLAVVRLFGADKATKRSFDLLLAVVGVLVAVLPGTALALCAEASMQCRTLMLPFVRVAGVALVLMALLCEFTCDHEESTGRKRRR